MGSESVQGRNPCRRARTDPTEELSPSGLKLVRPPGLEPRNLQIKNLLLYR
jgi:hypothetical protein